MIGRVNPAIVAMEAAEQLDALPARDAQPPKKRARRKRPRCAAARCKQIVAREGDYCSGCAPSDDAGNVHSGRWLGATLAFGPHKGRFR